MNALPAGDRGCVPVVLRRRLIGVLRGVGVADRSHLVEARNVRHQQWLHVTCARVICNDLKRRLQIVAWELLINVLSFFKLKKN